MPYLTQVRCDELDLMEANRYAFHSVAHAFWDGSGVGNGIGGTKGWSDNSYGPDGSVIDTNDAFHVSSTYSNTEPSVVTTTLQQHQGE